MSRGLLFWIIMLILAIGFFVNSKPPAGTAWPWRSLGVSLVIWILLLLLGWQVFGPPLHG